MSTDPIHVDFEYGDLREVIVGRGVMRYPDVDRARWMAEALRVLPEAEADKYRARSGQDSRDLAKYALMEAENDALIGVLEQFDIVVHRPRSSPTTWSPPTTGRSGWCTATSRDTAATRCSWPGTT